MRSRRQLDERTFADRTGSTGRPKSRADRRCRQRRLMGGVLLAAVLLSAPGCQLNRSFFQMDSNSRVPFFGVDLAPSLPRRSSSVDGVSRLQSQTAQRGQPATATGDGDGPPPAKSLSLPLSDSVVTSATTEEAPVEAFR
jgi:hypothetical protein